MAASFACEEHIRRDKANLDIFCCTLTQFAVGGEMGDGFTFDFSLDRDFRPGLENAGLA